MTKDLIRPFRLSRQIQKSVYTVLYKQQEIYEMYNNKYNTKIYNYKITITKVIPVNQSKTFSIYYIINDENKDEQKFIDRNKALIIKKLKKMIRIRKFPYIKFINDENYSKIVESTTKILDTIDLDLLNEKEKEYKKEEKKLEEERKNQTVASI